MAIKKNIENKGKKSVNTVKGLTLTVDTSTEKASTIDIGARIKQARAALGLSQQALADAIGGSKRGIQDNESGANAPASTLLRGIVALGVNANWLLTGDGPMLLSELLSNALEDFVVAEKLQRTADTMRSSQGEFVSIPLYDVQVAAGVGSVVDAENVVDFLSFKHEWIRSELHASPSDLYLVHVDGESMEPTLRPGDVILIDHRDQSVSRDGVYVLRMDGALLVKRLQRKPGGLIKVSSDNQAYDSFEVSPSDFSDFSVIGRVVWSGRRM